MFYHTQAHKASLNIWADKKETKDKKSYDEKVKEILESLVESNVFGLGNNFGRHPFVMT